MTCPEVVPATPFPAALMRPRPAGRAGRRGPNAIEWVALAALAAVLGAGTLNALRAGDAPAAPVAQADAALAHVLGAPSGVLTIINPANCTLTREGAAALNAVANVPGLRVVVLVLALAAGDSAFTVLRRDFGLSDAVLLRAAAHVNGSALPDVFRQPVVAVIKRGRVQHAAWGDALRTIDLWLPGLVDPVEHFTHPTPG